VEWVKPSCPSSELEPSEATSRRPPTQNDDHGRDIGRGSLHRRIIPPPAPRIDRHIKPADSSHRLAIAARFRRLRDRTGDRFIRALTCGDPSMTSLASRPRKRQLRATVDVEPSCRRRRCASSPDEGSHWPGTRRRGSGTEKAANESRAKLVDMLVLSYQFKLSVVG